MKLRHFIPLLLFLSTLLAATNIWLSWQVELQLQDVEETEENEFAVLQLAEQLRHTSDDLTRFAREYVLTGNPEYKEHFNQIRDIRAGRIPRPEDYDGIYWDLVVAGRLSGPGADPAIGGVALHELALELGITDSEYQLLVLAESRSEALTDIEQLAFSAFEGNYTHPETGEQITGSPNPELAHDLLHNSNYLQAKADIMEPIASFNEQALHRTRTMLSALEAEAETFVIMEFFSALGLMALILLTGLILSNRVLRRVSRLATTATAVDNGDLDSRSGVQGDDELGLLGRTFDHMMDKLSHTMNALSTEKKEVENQNLKLHEMNEVKNNFVGMAAHDLRNPLSSIRGFSEILLQNKELDEDDAQFLKVIHDNSSNMLHMVNELLDVSVIESGHMELNLTEFTFSELLNDHYAVLNPIAREKGTVLETSIEDEGKIVGDNKRLGQVIDNLVTNAIKFSPSASTIRIYLTGTDQGIRFAVADQGPGLTDEDKSIIFKDFQRLSARPTAGESSTGLGLSIVKRIVDAHGGDIRVESEYGKGATFIVDIPRKNSASVDNG